MKMSKIQCTIIVMLTALSLNASEVVSTKHRPASPKSRPSGGLVEKPHSGNVFQVFNMQQDYPYDKLAALTETIRHRVLLPIECREIAERGNVQFLELAANLVSQNGIGAIALVVNDSALPIELISPDGRWGILNVRPLKADTPSADLFERRFEKAYWGIVARTLGAGMSSFPGCVLVPFTTMKELDSIKAIQPCPEPYNKMIDTGKAYGIEVLTVTTYRSACRQGWAPKPTNDIQRTIWRQVHQIPDKPITIEFDPKKDK